MTDVEAVQHRRASGESRRSTRVRLKVVIEAHGISEPLTCEGETLVVNLHGALILTAVALRVGTKMSIHVYVTDRRAAAEVVYVDPANHDTAESNWRDQRTFGESLPRQMIGRGATQSLLCSRLHWFGESHLPLGTHPAHGS
jgi:hypothetical protein